MSLFYSYFFGVPGGTWMALSVAGYITYYLSKCVQRPVMAVNPDSKFAQFLTSHLSVLQEKYWPTPWCLEARLQTVLGSLFRSQLPNIDYQRELVDLPDGGVVALDWHRASFKGAKKDDPHPIVLLVPGLTGSSQSDYIRSLIHVSEKIGASCVVLNQRGRGGVKLKTPRTYCAANSEDLGFVIDHLHKTFPRARLMLTGVSLGGMIVGNYLQQQSSAAVDKVLAAMIISVPWNVFVGCASLETPHLNLMLNRHLADCLVDSVKMHEDVINHENAPWNWKEVCKSRTIREFDASFVVKQFGFRDVEDYYTAASLNDKLHRIQVPLLGLNAADDPFIPFNGVPLEQVKQTSHVAIVMTSHGGHIGFMEGMLPFRQNYIDRVFAEYCRAALANPELIQQ
ncbi:Phospholipase ABHD3 [Amphibalanus amphitrite]|uniref:Phospholipase ABHD3 n=1 Tax=Amphibalanus amphitrite TaxID=1232801 RepID=A0A6A4WFW4_AMPAM|nr:Phospholipase ABHD3 [Amphibalanus amphitrite]